MHVQYCIVHITCIQVSATVWAGIMLGSIHQSHCTLAYNTRLASVAEHVF